MLITIGIPTYKRAKQLNQLLVSIFDMEVSKDLNINILIADNEGLEGEGIKLCLQSNLDKRFPITALPVEEPGISQTRNKLLEHSFEHMASDYLVMVDDDEIVSKRWILELVNMAIKTKADVVGGLKTPRFTLPPEKWMIRNDVYFYQPSKEDGICERLVSTDNLLISKEIYLKHNKPKFNNSFGLTGGGDTEYLHRLKKTGAVLAYSKSALTYEIIPSDRMSLKWAINRSKRIGIGLARINILHEPGLKNTLFFWCKLATIFAIASILYILLFWSRQRRIKYKLICIKQLGKVEGYMGKRVFPYQHE